MENHGTTPVIFINASSHHGDAAWKIRQCRLPSSNIHSREAARFHHGGATWKIHVTTWLTFIEHSELASCNSTMAVLHGKSMT
jgi:hypothetical protein